MLAPYDKIEERWEADPAVEKRLARERWVATEKIHGAHFVVVAGADGGPLRFGKRRELIPPGESFFGHEVVVARLRDALLRAVDAVRRRWDAHDATVQLYGELFGGRYPHPDVAPEPGVAPVQSGVWYSPRVELCFYDVAIVRGEGRTFAPFDEGMALLADAGLFVAEPIVIGSLAEVRAVAVERVTAIPARLGLPALPAEEGPNLAEGVVLKTVREVALPGGLRARPIVKRKLPRFAEDERYHGAQKPRPPARASGDALARLLEAAASLVTPPRLDSARSKLGPAVGADRLADEARDDILDELQRRHAADMAALTDADRAILGDQIVGMTRALST
jgi:Rnl2 family RNA ligase